MCPPPLIDHTEYTVADGEPYERYRYHLCTKGYGTMFAIVADIFAEDAMVEQPLVE